MSVYIGDLRKGMRINSSDGYGYEIYRVISDPQVFDDGGVAILVRSEADGDEMEFFAARRDGQGVPYIEIIPED